MAKRRTRSVILEEMEKLKKQLVQIDEQEERRFGKLANKAGLLDLDVSDEDILAAFIDVRARFQGSKKAANRTDGIQIAANETAAATNAVA